MTEDDLLKLIRTGKAPKVLEILSRIPEAERRAHARAVAELFRDGTRTEAFWLLDDRLPGIVDTDSLRIAMLATATPSELRRHSVDVIPRRLPLAEVIRALAPGWIDRWVDDLIAESPHFVGRLACLWREGLAMRPASDAYILGYYAHHRDHALSVSDPGFLERDVWRFFEVEGGGEFSLAGHDKYSAPALQWTTVLLGLAEQGRLDRFRLLDASLDALERDFAQFRAGWYSRFHTALVPTLDEMAARRDRYLRLLDSSIPPTVSFALKALGALDRAGRLPAAAMLPGLAPALQARQKSTVTGALRLLASAARKEPDRATEIARLAAAALISESADVQSKALDLVDSLGATADPEVRDTLAAHRDMVAPSVQDRLAKLVGAPARAAPATAPAPGATEAAASEPVAPLASPGEALAALLEVLETPRDPFAVERAVDGLARHGAAVLGDAEALSPLRRRAQQLLRNPGEVHIRVVLAATGLAWCEARPLAEVLARATPDPEFDFVPPRSFARVFLDRNAEIVEQVRAGRSLPMLSAPSDSSGAVAPGDLLERLADYRAAGAAPGRTDLNLALLRLARDGRAEALAGFAPATGAERAVAFALGADEVPAGDAALWAAAWAARQPAQAHPAIAALCGAPLADAGRPASCELRVIRRQGDGFRWCVVEVPVVPEPRRCGAELLPGLFYPPSPNRYFHESPCGYTYADVAWASLLRPVWTEPFFRQALLEMETDQKLTDHYCRAYLEPFLRPGPAAGPLGAATLVYYLASADKSVTALAVEAVAQLVAEGRLRTGDFVAAMRRFLGADALPTARWTRGLAEIAAVSPAHAAFVRQVIAELLDLAAGTAPRDMGGMLELLFELHVAARAPLRHPEAARHLGSVTAGGKLGRYSKKLLEMAG